MAGGDHAPGQLHVRALEGVAALRVEDADQVDHRIGAGELLPQHLVAVDVGAAHADLRQHAQRAVLLAVAAEQRDAVAVGGQSRHQVAADEAGAAEDDEFLCRHGNQSLRGIEVSAATPPAVLAAAGVLTGHSTARRALLAFGSPYGWPIAVSRLASGTTVPCRRQS